MFLPSIFLGNSGFSKDTSMSSLTSEQQVHRLIESQSSASSNHQEQVRNRKSPARFSLSILMASLRSLFIQFVSDCFTLEEIIGLQLIFCLSILVLFSIAISDRLEICGFAHISEVCISLCTLFRKLTSSELIFYAHWLSCVYAKPLASAYFIRQRHSE